MQHRFQRASLAPDGFIVDGVKVVAEGVQILLRSRQPLGTCPDCGRQSRRVQSRYLRRPADLPLGGRRVELTIVARRFWCDAVLCGRRIFCEQFDGSVLARYGRRTQRLETIVHHLGLALGGRPAAAFVNRLMMPVSNDSLLRVVRRRIDDQSDELTVIGIDDFAFRRGQTYGTIVCDLERRRPVIARLMTAARDDLAKSEAILVAAIEMNVPELVVARTAIGDFQSMIRSKTARKLDGWLETAKNSLVGSFAGGVEKDIAAVRNAIISPWSNGQTEGQITRLKLIKRQMYGRAKLDLLQARLIGAS